MADKKVVFAEFSLFIITIIWGLGFPITKLAVNYGFEANTIMVGRFLTATIILGIIYRKRLKFLNRDILIYGTITGLFLFFGFFFQTLGSVYTTPSKNGFITQLNIVFVPYLYFLFFKKKVDLFNIISVVVAIIGMFILSYSSNGFSGVNIGDIYTFICAIMVAFNVVTGSFYQKKYNFDPALFVLVNIFVSMILSVTFMLAVDEYPEITVISLWPLLVLGVFNTALGFLVQSYALKISLPTKVSLIVALESVFGVVGSVLIIGEPMTLRLIIGGLLIISGIVITEIKPFRKRRMVRLT
ncbi:MAG: DMT family transporter [Candidatus Izemoplasmataceae bacterium]